MSLEKEQNPYESLERATDGSLVRESELDEYEASLKEVKSDPLEEVAEDEKYTVPSESSPPKRRMGRRAFLTMGTGAAVYGALKKVDFFEDIDTDALIKKAKDYAERFEDRKESVSQGIPPMDQLLKYGEIKNLHAGIRAVQSEHYEHLTKNKSGKNDMRMAVENMSGLNMPRFTQPFRNRGLPTQLCYMIAIQETRGKNVTSWGGAEGMMGIMPATAKALGYRDVDLHDPYVASEISAQYCAEEKQRFDSGDMILHAYNTGAGLFGFTKETPKEHRTPEKFYAYMQEYMNAKIEKYDSQGYFGVKIRKEDTLSEVSRKWGVSLQKLYALNGMNENTVLRIGQEVHVPFVRTEAVLGKIFRKEFEALRYTPEVKAKYEAIRDQGLLAKLESGLVKKSSRTV